ncbi:MAG: TonB-dependent receptor, partial [Rubricoccaceae bacterium]|nr:TonB-dependent receptor [Rubricoccaceae bacterium]
PPNTPPAGPAPPPPPPARAAGAPPLSQQLGLMGAARRSTLDWFFDSSVRQDSAAVVVDLLGSGTGRGVETDYRFYDAEAKLTWDIRPNHRIVLNGVVGDDRFSADHDRIVSRTDPEQNVHVDDSRDGGAVSARYRYLGRRAFVSTLLYRSWVANSEWTTNDLRLSVVERQKDLRYRETGARIDADYFQSLAHQVRGGLWLRRRDLDAELFERATPVGDLVEERRDVEDAGSFDAVMYFQDAWQPSDRVSVLAGVRAGVYANGTYIGINPGIFARWSIIPERLYLRTGVSRQTQSLHRLHDRFAYRYDLTAAHWLLSSNSVSPGSAWQVGVGTEWAPTEALGFSVDTYGRAMTDILEPIDARGIGQTLVGPGVTARDILRFFRPSQGRAVGVEIAARAQHGAWLAGLSYALSRSEVRLKGTADWRLGMYDRPHVLSTLLQFQHDGFLATARLSVQSGWPNATARHSTETMFDVSAGYRVEWKGARLEIRAQALNLPAETFAPPQSGSAGDSSFLATDVLLRRVLPIVSITASW